MPPDEPNRDKLYGATPAVPTEEDDGELQLEPLAPDELERRPTPRIDVDREAIDIDAIYTDWEGSRDAEILQEWFRRLRKFDFQFRLKHLLGLTAAVAILLALGQWFGPWTLLFMCVSATVIWITLYLTSVESQRQREATHRREQLYADRRARSQRSGPPPPGPPPSEPVRTPLESVFERASQRQFRFQFSLAQIFAMTTVAAVLLGLISASGGLLSAASILGIVAVVGILIHVGGYEPPEMMVFGWWLLLAMYIALCATIFFWTILRDA